MSVYEIKSEEDFANVLGQSNKIVVVDFSATWCGPCKKAAPLYSRLATLMPEILFCKLDIDELDSIAKKCVIKSVPTFIYFKNGREITRTLGADVNVVFDVCKKLL